MKKEEFLEKLLTRTSRSNAESIADAFDAAGVLSNIHFLRDGQSASVFDIKGSNLVLKIFDRRTRINPRINDSRFQLRDNFRRILRDESEKDQKQNPTEVVVEIEPKLTEQGLAILHQEMLRYKLWKDEGLDFLDIYPPESNPREVKNVMLDHRGVPYVIDEDATKRFEDKYNEYPPGPNGKRTDEQYRHYRADSLDRHGRPDVISDEKFAEIKKACALCDWPKDQKTIFDSQIDHDVLKQFSDIIRSLKDTPAQKWTNRESTGKTTASGVSKGRSGGDAAISGP